MLYDNARRVHWKNAGYRTNMGSAAIGLPPSKPYRRLYHLSKEHHALSNLRKERLKVTRISEANDPFELMSLNFRDKRIRSAVTEYRTALNNEHGLLCFSEDWTSPLLWSMYADNHRGICLGFDVSEEFVEKITYEDQRIRAELNDETGDPFTLPENLQQKLHHTKCSEWSHEQERRRFFKLNDAILDGELYFWPWGNEVRLAEVILGHHCQTELLPLRAEIKHRHLHAHIFSARLAWQHFKVVPAEKSVEP